MVRSAWEFKFPTADILEAARRKLAFHQGRQDWWSEKAEKVKETIRSEGIEISEGIAGGELKYASNARQPTVHVRADLMADMAECQTKIQEHKAHVKDYDGWVQFLEAATEDRVALTHADWLFFFNKR